MGDDITSTISDVAAAATTTKTLVDVVTAVGISVTGHSMHAPAVSPDERRPLGGV